MFEPENLNLWKMPSHYFGETWPNYYVFLVRNKYSDLLTESNFEKGLEKIGGESETVVVVREGHFLCGWVEWIGIHIDDENALKIADKISKDLKNYPVIDEDDLSERESNEADRVWKDNYNPSERIEYIRQNDSQFEFRDYADLIGCVRGNYFSGYASELIGN